MLIIFSGLPASGKTKLSALLARKLKAVHLRIDSIEQALEDSVLQIHPAENAGYVVGYAVAKDNLKAGSSVIADSVNPIEITRSDWRNTAISTNAPYLEIEVICSDPEIHRKRLEARKSDISGLRPVAWQAVLDREYDPWDCERLVIDTAHIDVNKCVEQILDALKSLNSTI